jgi:hypothetical protein
MAAEAFILFLDEKNQKSSHPKCFFAALWPCPAKQVKPRATFFWSKGRSGFPFCKTLMPLQPHKTSMFYLLSPEAAWLTLSEHNQYLVIRHNQKEAQWPVRARGREFCPVRWQRLS